MRYFLFKNVKFTDFCIAVWQKLPNIAIETSANNDAFECIIGSTQLGTFSQLCMLFPVVIFVSKSGECLNSRFRQWHQESSPCGSNHTETKIASELPFINIYQTRVKKTCNIGCLKSSDPFLKKKFFNVT